MKPGDLVLTRDNLDPDGNHFIPYGTLCLVLGPAPCDPEDDPDLRVTVHAANGVVANICRANLRPAYEAG